MWMIELAANTSTADSRIGSHSDKSDVTPTSPGCLAELDAGSKLHTRLRTRRSLRLAGRAEHWTTGIREVEPALAVRHAHAVCPQKIEAEQHLAPPPPRRPAASVVDLELHDAGPAARPIRERCVAVLLRLEQTHRVVGQVELDVDLLEEVIAQE